MVFLPFKFSYTILCLFHAQIFQFIQVFFSENNVLILNQAVDGIIKQVPDYSIVSSILYQFINCIYVNVLA